MNERSHYEWNTWASALAHIHFSEYDDQFRLTRLAHTHEFYEMFICLHGRCGHKANGMREELAAGSVLIIRPNDRHCFCDLPGKEAEGRYVNIEISRTLFALLLEYVGDEAFKRNVDQSPRPLRFQLTADQRDWLEQVLPGNITNYRAVSDPENRIRAMLPLICSLCIDNKTMARQGLPAWLEKLCEEMKKPENYVKDMQYFVDFSGKSHGHVCGSFRKYLQTTPVEYFNTVRINYCAYLLRHTNRDILDIAMCAGFESVSYFFSQFKKRFQTTPGQYRRWQNTGSAGSVIPPVGWDAEPEEEENCPK